MEKFNLKLDGEFKSISSFEWNNIPKLSIIVGKNGAGKTQLLELIHTTVSNQTRMINNDSTFKVFSSIIIDKGQLVSPFSYAYRLPSYNSNNGLSVGNAYIIAINIKLFAIKKEIINLQKINNLHFREKIKEKILPLEKEKALLQIDNQDISKVKAEIINLTNELSEKQKEKNIEIELGFKTQKSDLETYKKNLSSTGNLNIENKNLGLIISEIEKRSKKQVLKLDPEEVLFYLPLGILFDDRRDFLNKLDFLILIHEEKIKISKSYLIPFDAVKNSSPIDLINNALEKTSLPFRLKINSKKRKSSLSYFNSTEHLPILFDKINNIENLDYSTLSSGEKTLMSLALKLYVDNQSSEKQKAKLMLLDEPDAFLHPSMLVDFYKIVYEFFVKERGVRVIFTTHSPTTVALAPDNIDCRIFNLKKPTYIEPVSKEYAVDDLSEGLIIVNPTSKFIIVEGVDDKPFYESIYKKLVRDKVIPSKPSLIFIPGKNKDSVKHFVKELNESQYNYFGIIDKDKDEVTEDDLIHTLNRYSIENYFLDPIVSFFTCSSKFSGFSHFKIESSQVSEVSSFSNDKLQELADFIFKCITVDDDWNKELLEVEFLNGKKLKYPKWLFEERGKEILTVFQNKLSSPKLFNRVYLQKHLIISGMIPNDLISIYKKIIEA